MAAVAQFVVVAGMSGAGRTQVGHILEESRRPMAEEVWHLVEEQATAHFHAAGQAGAAAPGKP